MCHRSGPVELCEKMLEYIKMCHRSGPVELCEKNARIYNMCHRSGPVELCEYFEKKTFIFKYQKCDRSGPVELCEKMLEYIKCATGPDLWIYVKKC